MIKMNLKGVITLYYVILYSNIYYFCQKTENIYFQFKTASKNSQEVISCVGKGLIVTFNSY